MAINKEYNDVQLDVKFTQASTRDNLVSEENISVSFGKLAKWHEALVPTGGSSGKILAWNTTGTAKWSDPLHPTITKSTDTTSTVSPGHGDTFTTVDSVTRDAYGHVTKINTKTITLPANPVPSNNVTGSGTSGYLTKWNGTHTITNGPQLGSSTTTFLRNDGTWATPTDTNTTYTLGTSGNNVTLTPSPSGSVQSITVPYATNATTSDNLKITGYGTGNLTFYQANDDFGGTEGRKGNRDDNYWSHYIIANHGNGETYYHYTIRLPFYGSPQYQRKTGGSDATSNRTKWFDIITEENYTSYTVTKTGGGASGTWGISITGNASTSTKATQDGDGNTISSTYLRARSSVTTDGGATGWSQIGINQYNNAYPDGVTNKIYSYGAVVSMPAPNARFDLYYNHNSSTAGATTNGLQYRTGWNDDKKAWRMLIDNVNYTEYMPYKKPIKFQFNNGITNGYWAKLFSANYNSYNILEIDIVTYHGYDGNFRSKLHIRFTNAGFVPGESSIISHQNIAPGSLRITQDDANTFSLWIKCDGTSSRFGYEILNISDESSVFFNGVTLTAARWSFPTTFTKSDTAPTNAVTATRYFALDNHTHNFKDPTVTQTADNSSNSDSYELLISNSANNTTETAGVRKSTRLRFNPSTGRVIMQGPLIVRATDGAGSYDEGIRINAGKNGYSSLSFGGGQDTISGTADGQFWMGTNSTNDSFKRKLYIAHAASTGSGTYFYVSSATQVSPALKLGTSGSIVSDNKDAVTGGVVYTALSNYLPLSGGSLSGTMNFKSTTYDGSAANNGVSSGISYPTTFNILDKSSRILVRLEGVINSSGSIGSYWYVRNYNTSGTQVGQKGISMTMAKDGTLTYAVSDGDKFRSAIGAGTSNLTIGTTSTTAAAGDHEHHLTSYSFTATQPMSRYVSFDQNSPSGAPEAAWFNGFISSHNNYVASYIINRHRTMDWYVGWGEWSSSTSSAEAPTWYKLLHSGNTYQAASNGTTGGWSVIGINPAVTGHVLKSIRINQTSPNWLSGDFGAGIAFGGYDTKGVISMRYQYPVITFAGGNHNSSKTEPVWYFKISGTSGSTYNLDNLLWATLLKPISTTTTASASTWNIPSGSYQVWGERFSDTRLKYTPSGGSETTITDTGDLVMWLTGNATSNQATLNMRIDGTYYGSFSGNITGNVSGNVAGNVNGKLYHTGTGCSWWNDRDNAVIRITTGDTGYRPLWTLLTATSGSWGMGNHVGDDLTFNFISKAVYDSKANPSTYAQIKFTNTGAITANGLTLSNSDYGPLSIIRTGHAYYAGIKFYNNGSTYLGSFGINTVNGRFFRFNIDEATGYEIIDRSIVRNNTTVGTLGWTSVSADTVIPTVNTIAYWNGAHSGTSSNLAYCKQGAFGTIVTKNTGDYLSSSTKYAGSSSVGGAANSSNVLNSNTRMDYGWNGVNYFNINATAGNAAKVNDTPTSAWWHIMRFNHGNAAGYYTDLAIPFNDISLYYKRITQGSVQNGGWVKVLDALNVGYVMSSSVIKYDSHARRFTSSKTDSAWNAQAYSNTGYADNVYVSFRPGQTTMYAMIGLDTNPSEDADYVKIDYCWYIRNDGTMQVYESGTGVTISGHTTYASGDEFRVEYSCGEIRYYHNGTMCRSVTRAVSGKLFFDSSFYNAGNVYDFSYGTSTHSTHTAQIITSTYKSATYVTSLTSSVITLSDAASSFGGWICGPTKNGRIAISSYQGDNDKLYFGYGERGRTTNSYVKTMTWDGPTNTLTADKFVGALQGNVTGNCSGSSGSCTGTAANANKINTNAGATDRPVYFSGGVPVQCNTPASGSWWKGVPLIGTDGVTEIGRIIDFHSTNTSTADYDMRLQYTGTATGKTITLPGATGTAALLTKGSTNYWGQMDGAGSISEWIRTTSSGLIPSQEAKFFQAATSSLGTIYWYFKNSYIQYMNANSLVLGAAKTADGAAKGQLKFFSGNASDATGTVTLECINDAVRTGDYTVKLPTCNGTIPVFEKLFQGASNTVSLSYSDIEEYDLFLITVANSNASSEPVTVTSLWISNVAGIHDMPLIWGGAPTSSGGACNVTSGWIQLSKSSGTTTFVVAHKPSVAQMTSSGWTISSPTYNLYIRKIFGLKTYKRT